MKTKLLCISLILTLGLSAFGTDNEVTITQVIGGLHSPRGLAFGPGDKLFVAEAGDRTAGKNLCRL
jgi:hypothetical protein